MHWSIQNVKGVTNHECKEPIWISQSERQKKRLQKAMACVLLGFHVMGIRPCPRMLYAFLENETSL